MRAAFAGIAAVSIGVAALVGLYPVWFALAKLGLNDPILDWAFWHQSMPAVAIALAVGATGLLIADRRPRIALALLLASPVAAIAAAVVILALTL